LWHSLGGLVDCCLFFQSQCAAFLKFCIANKLKITQQQSTMLPEGEHSVVVMVMGGAVTVLL